MLYIDALGLIEKAIKSDLLMEENGGILVYREESTQSKEGWYLEEKDTVAKELMNDEEWQREIIKALKEKGIDYVPTDPSLLVHLNNILKM